MRTRSFILWAIPALMMAGCQNDWENSQQADTGEEATVRITLQAPEAMSTTRASGDSQTNSARGGEDGTTQVVAPVTKTVQKNYADVTFDVRLVNNRTYKFVAWADFIKTGTEGTAGYPADLHYNTADLTNITCLDAATAQLNDESRDAYFITTNQTVNSAAGVSLTLKRPFAKVRVVTTDWNDNDVTPSTVKIKYYGCTRFTGLNAITGKATGGETDLPGKDDSSLTTYTATINPNAYALGYDETSTNKTLSVDYLWAENTQKPIHFTIKTELKSYDFVTDIPTQRNYLTTLLGNFLTENTKVTVMCDEEFDNDEDEWSYYYIHNETDLRKWAELVKTRPAVNAVLMADITLKESWIPVGTKDVPYQGTFYGNGHTIDNLIVNGSDYQAFIGVLHKDGYRDSKGMEQYPEIRDLNIGKNSSITGSGNYVGSIVGFINGGYIYNCHSAANVKGKTFVGGIVGYDETAGNGYISNCSFSGNISAGATAGGLSGFSMTGRYTGCYVTGNITGTGKIGGIIGHAISCRIIACFFTGQIHNSSIHGSSTRGGILGSDNMFNNIIACYSTGEMTSSYTYDYSAGSIAGVLHSSSKIIGCFWNDAQYNSVGGNSSYNADGSALVSDNSWSSPTETMNQAIKTWNAESNHSTLLNGYCDYHYEQTNGTSNPPTLAAGAPQ